MKFFKKTAIFSLTAIMLAGVSGCKLFQKEKDPQVVLKEMTEKMASVKSFSITADALTSFDNEKQNLSGKLKVGAKGKISSEKIKDKKNLKSEFSFEIEANDIKSQGKSYSGKAGASFVYPKTDLYVRLDKLDLPQEFGMYNFFIGAFVGKWFRIPQKTLNKSKEKIKKDETDVLSFQKFKEIFKKANIYTADKNLGKQKINSINTYHYSVKIDKDNFIKFINTLAEKGGKKQVKLTNKDIKEIESALNKDYNLEFFIGAKDSYLYKIKGEFNMEDKIKGKSNIKAEFVMNDFNKDFNIKAPEKSEDFDPSALLPMVPKIGTKQPKKKGIGEDTGL